PATFALARRTVHVINGPLPCTAVLFHSVQDGGRPHDVAQVAVLLGWRKNSVRDACDRGDEIEFLEPTLANHHEHPRRKNSHRAGHARSSGSSGLEPRFVSRAIYARRSRSRRAPRAPRGNWGRASRERTPSRGLPGPRGPRPEPRRTPPRATGSRRSRSRRRASRVTR